VRGNIRKFLILHAIFFLESDFEGGVFRRAVNFKKVALRRRDFLRLTRMDFRGIIEVFSMRKRVNNARFLFFISMKHSLSKLVISSLQSAVIAFFLMAPLLVFAADFSPREVFDFANTDRTTLGLPALRFDEVLSKAAAAKADDMVKNGYFAHTSPQGTTPWYFFEKEGYQYRYAGENLAIHFTDAAGEETAWMAREKHRENIL